MKELSTAEKAKRYDEILVKLQEAKVDNNVCDERYCCVIDDIVPELKENERIRNGIIQYLEQSQFGEEHYQIDDDIVRDYIAWLEKQGEIDKISYEIAEKEKREFVGDGFIKCYADFQDFKEGNTYWLEYMGDDKYNVRSDNLLGKTYHITPCQLYTIFKKMTWLEKQGEQKPADKVEPKFKVGDWIITDKKHIWLVCSITGYLYRLVAINGKVEVAEFEVVDKKARLWTIQDAKNGDVLATDDGNICVFDDTVEDGKYPFAYYGLIKRRFEFYDRRLPFTHDNVHPASKEQRDLLFQKMHEAGYVWNAKKLELKKVEQRPTEWTAEDEEELKIALNTLEEAGQYSSAKWLKNVCLVPQTKQEWSEEDDERMFDFAISAIGLCKQYAINHQVSGYSRLPDVPERYEELQNWLKSKLRPQSTWKPSDEQMVALDGICSYIRNKADWEISQDMVSDLYKLSEQLKKLREE